MFSFKTHLTVDLSGGNLAYTFSVDKELSMLGVEFSNRSLIRRNTIRELFFKKPTNISMYSKVNYNRIKEDRWHLTCEPTSTVSLNNTESSTHSLAAENRCMNDTLKRCSIVSSYSFFIFVGI